MTKRNKPTARQMQALCANVAPDDGIDPRELARAAVSRAAGGRKTLQLCGQVAQALNYALAAVCDDDVLRELAVLAVRPAPDPSRLLVLVGPSLPGPFDPAQALARLHQAHGKLRAEVAAAIHRKRTPELTWCVAPPPA